MVVRAGKNSWKGNSARERPQK